MQKFSTVQSDQGLIGTSLRSGAHKQKVGFMTAIIATELTRYYGSYLAVNHLSFDVKEGTIFGLLGPNGAGKSTTIKILTTLLPPSSGTAKVNGYDIKADPVEVRKSIGYVPQGLSADGDLSAYENLLMTAKLYGIGKIEREKKIHELLEFMELTSHKHQLVNQFSGGMIRRLEIGLALLHNPRFLFLDEPTIGLDPSARKTLWSYLEGWRKRYPVTILITTHDMDEADKLCDVVAFMYRGQIVAMDSPNNLKTSLGPTASLDDVFIHYTGKSFKEEGDYQNVKQTRRTVGRLD